MATHFRGVSRPSHLSSISDNVTVAELLIAVACLLLKSTRGNRNVSVEARLLIVLNVLRTASDLAQNDSVL